MASGLNKRVPGSRGGLAASLFFFATFQRVAPSAMVDDLMRSFDATAVIPGKLPAFFYWAYALVQIPVGIIVDKWGSRAYSLPRPACALGALAFAMTATLPVAYASRVLLDIGAGLNLITVLHLAVNWFPAERYAMVAGLTVSIGIRRPDISQHPAAYQTYLAENRLHPKGASTASTDVPWASAAACSRSPLPRAPRAGRCAL